MKVRLGGMKLVTCKILSKTVGFEQNSNSNSIHVEWEQQEGAFGYIIKGRKSGNIKEYKIGDVLAATVPDMEDLEVFALHRDSRLFETMEPGILKARAPSIVTSYIEENYNDLIRQIKKGNRVREYATTEMLHDIWYSWYQREELGDGYVETLEEDTDNVDPSKVLNRYMELYSKNEAYTNNQGDPIEHLACGVDIYRMKEEDDDTFDSEEQLFSKASLSREVDENPINIILEEDNLEDAIREIIDKTKDYQIPGMAILENCDLLLEAMTVDFDNNNIVTNRFINLTRKSLFSDYNPDRCIQNDFALVFRTKAKNSELYDRILSRVKKSLS